MVAENTYTITQIKKEKKNIYYTHSYTNYKRKKLKYEMLNKIIITLH